MAGRHPTGSNVGCDTCSGWRDYGGILQLPAGRKRELFGKHARKEYPPDEQETKDNRKQQQEGDPKPGLRLRAVIPGSNGAMRPGDSGKKGDDARAECVIIGFAAKRFRRCNRGSVHWLKTLVAEARVSNA